MSPDAAIHVAAVIGGIVIGIGVVVWFGVRLYIGYLDKHIGGAIGTAPSVLEFLTGIEK